MLPARFVMLRNIPTNIPRLRWSAALFAGIVALLLSAWPIPVAAGDRAFIDSAGRRVELPAGIERVFAAGPPAAVLLYSMAPEELIGWPQDLSAEAKGILPARYAALPVVGRLTGHDNGVAVADVVALRPDLIVDVGDIEPEYVELANRVQQESGIPYVLIDGSLAKTADAYRSLGSILDVQPAAEDLARRADALLDGVRATLAKAGGDGPARLLRARQGRPGDGSARIGPRRGHRILRTQLGRPVIVGRRACQTVGRGDRPPGSGHRRHLQPRPVRDDLDIGAMERRSGRARAPHLSLAEQSVRMGRFAARNQSPDRRALARRKAPSVGPTIFARSRATSMQRFFTSISARRNSINC